MHQTLPLPECSLTESQYLGALYGLLIGDAVGVPYEFHPPSSLPPLEQIDLHPPEGFDRAHRSVAAGTWSDDGAQALCLLASLRHCGKLDLNDLAKRMIDWQNIGYLAVDNDVFDIGVQTAKMLTLRRQQLNQGIDLNELCQLDIDSSNHDPYSNGNGSLMRVLPLVLWHNGTLEALVLQAHQQSWLTHPHPRSQVCCALYCLWAKAIIEDATPCKATRNSDVSSHQNSYNNNAKNSDGNPQKIADYQQAWQRALEQLKAIYRRLNLIKYLDELTYHIQPDDRDASATGSGYVVDSLRSALWAQQFEGYEAIIKAAISLGHDTDTTACIAGGIAGLRFGLEGIPIEWQHGLRGKTTLAPFLPIPQEDANDYLVFNWNF